MARSIGIGATGLWRRTLTGPAVPDPFAAESTHPAPAAADPRRRIGDHIAFALPVYTVLQVAVTMAVLRAPGAAPLPIATLALLVVLVVPASARFARNWQELPDSALALPATAARLRRHLALLWAAALAAPFVLTALLLAAARLLGAG